MNIGLVQGQKLVFAASNALQVAWFVLDFAAGVGVREIVRFAGIHALVSPRNFAASNALQVAWFFLDFAAGWGVREIVRFQGIHALMSPRNSAALQSASAL